MEDRELSETAKNIVNQAQNWNFEGDCMLLQWMEQISKNLETRAKTITESLDKVAKNLCRAQISLENTQNSLNALQYTQYVEMRCQEDELPVEAEAPKDEAKEQTQKEILKVFLQNNLKMLHNCHDKFNFLEDSDEDDVDNVASAENCIYQPRNPYNERLLPHIFGTKMWKENWHIGLCDESVQNYSGDEASDVYSLSSTSSCGENESMESHNTGNLSQWTSSVSLNNEITNNNNKMGSHVPATTSIASSSKSELPLPKVANNPQLIQGATEMGNNMERETSIPNLERTENLEPSIPKKRTLQSKTLNLFDDNDFESLMSQITDKAQAKQNSNRPQRNVQTGTEQISREKPKVDLFASRSNSPIADNNLPSVITADDLPATNQKTTNINLFDSPTDDFPPVARFEPPSKKMNLFEDLEDDSYNRENLLTNSAKAGSTKVEKKTMISAKSLFDDDDDGDEDFLNIFGKSKSRESSTTAQVGNWHKENKNKSTTKAASLFDDDVGNDDFIFSQQSRPPLNKLVEETPRESAHKIAEPLNKEPLNSSKPNNVQENKRISNIFLDESDDDENSFSFAKANQNKPVKNTAVPKVAVLEKETVSSAERNDLSNLQNLDDDSLFNTLPTPTPRTKRAVDVERSKAVAAYIVEEPPEDTVDQHEKLHATVVHKPIKIPTAGDSADDFFDSLATSKSMAKTKVVSSDSPDLDDSQYTISNTAAEISTQKEKEPSLTSKPSTINTESAANDNITTIQKPPVKEACLSRKEVPTDSTPIDNSTQLSTETPKEVALLASNSNAWLEKEVEDLNANQEAEPAFESSVTPALQASAQLTQPVPSDTPPDFVEGEVVGKVATDTADFSKPPTFEYSPLFLDEPPDDDFFQMLGSNPIASQSHLESDFFDPTISTEKVNVETKAEDPAHISTGYYIGLFSEVPPEDEEESTNFLDTVSRIVTESLSKAQQSGTDSSQAASNNVPEKIPAKRKNEQATVLSVNNSKSVLNKFPQPKDIPKDMPPKATVSKLKMPSININVQALLPNAASKPKTDKTTNVGDSILTSTETPNTSENVTSSKETHSVAGRENILTSLCKNRVRGPLNRRASTRVGRQESYRKSLENEQKDQKEEEQSSKSAENIKKKTNVAVTPAISKEDITKTEIRAPNPVNAATMLPRQPLPTAVRIQTHQQEASKKPQIKAGNKLFDELVEEEDNDDFFSSLVKAQTSKKVEQKSSTNVSKPTSIPFEFDRDLFAQSSGAIPKVVQSATAQPSTASKVEPQTQKKVEPKLVQNVKSQPAIVKEVEPQTKKKDTLFGSDSNDEDDDLFSALSKTKAPVKVSTNIQKEVKKTDKSLFSDSEDDALSKPKGSATISTSKPKEVKEPNKSLFSDSENEPKVSARISTSKPKEVKVQNKSLFSDSEDDDDLFGKSAPKTKKDSALRVTAPVKKSTSTLKTPLTEKTKTLASTSTAPSDNPLADLLDS